MSDAHEFIITLNIDGMYFQEARRLRELAVGKDKERIETSIPPSTTEDNFLKIMNDPSRGIDSISEEEVDTFSLEMHDNWQPFQLAAAALYSPVAATHMLCAACLEAHINIRAEELLNETDFAEFDRLSVTAKWQSYPMRKGVMGFDSGRRPFQNFQRLIRRRNALMHYKDSKAKVKMNNPYNVPAFIQQLGLTTEAADESLATVRAMIAALAKMEESDVPAWIDGAPCVAFKWA